MTKPQKRPVLVVVRDGWGQNPFPEWNHANAVVQAYKPVDDWLQRQYPTTLIKTSGEDVGLPAGVMGNSEVGHQNIGAGRIVDQELMRITRLIRTGEFFQNPVLKQAVAYAKDKKSKIHLMGLASEAGVHSSLEHVYGLLRFFKDAGLGDRVFLHNFGDGRDSPPNSGVDFCREILAKIKEIGAGTIASVIGRFYAMDRDHRWERVEKAYRLLTEGTGKSVRDPLAAYEDYYKNPSQPTLTGDEFIDPTIVVGSDGKPLATVTDQDVVIFYNFRGDRPREITEAFCLDQFPYTGKAKDGATKPLGFQRSKKLDLFFVTLTEYQQGLPVQVAIRKPPKMVDILGSYVADMGLRQFRCAETEKFPHVTFFFNDYREPPLDGEDRQIVPSPRDVSTYDQKPEMSAFGVTDEMLRRIQSGQYDLMILNYANGDMVGHTGSLAAATKAVEVVDQCVGRVVKAVLAKGGAAIVTADHGNCEQMIDPRTGGPHTSHTTYDVPLVVVDDRFKGQPLRPGGRLADIAPTALHLLGLSRPSEMTGQSLLER